MVKLRTGVLDCRGCMPTPTTSMYVCWFSTRMQPTAVTQAVVALPTISTYPNHRAPQIERPTDWI